MNSARIRARIATVRTELDELEKLVAEETSDTSPQLYLAPEEYADRAHVSIATVRRWLRAGLPCVRRGRVVRIKVAEADAWTPAEARDRSARHAAHRGDR
jgi:hypothetical protein